MKIHILNFKKSPNSTKSTELIPSAELQMFIDAAKKLKCDIEIINSYDCLTILDGKPHLKIENIPLNSIKVLYTRANFTGKFLAFQASLIKQFEFCGINVLNNHDAVLAAKDQLGTLQILTKNKIPTPQSILVRSPEQIKQAEKYLGKPPYILKMVHGTKGKGVFIIETKRSLRSIANIIVNDENYPPVLIQKYIKEAEGKDLRVWVVGGKVVGAMERKAKQRGEFRANFSLGGTIKKIKLTAEEKKVAVKAAKALGLDVAGVDIIRSKEGPKVLEVNCNPGLEGISQAMEQNMAEHIIKYAMSKIKK